MAELPGGDAAGDVALELPAAGEVGTELAAADGAGVELEVEVRSGPGVTELSGGEGAGDVALGLPAAVEAGAELAAADGAASRATEAATGSDEGVSFHFSASVAPCGSERVAAAT